MSQHKHGSSHQLLQWTKQSRDEIAASLNNILSSKGSNIEINPDCIWRPDGLNDLKEYTLKDFISKFCTNYSGFNAELFSDWWVGSGTNPTWDFISTCTINNKEGLLLVEAKSHIKEMEIGGKLIRCDKERTTKDLKNYILKLFSEESLDLKCLKSVFDKLSNHDKIGLAIAEACGALSNYIPSICISRDNHYQLSNRIASAWKLAQCGISSVLLYLGFVDDNYWPSTDRINDNSHWLDLMKTYLSDVGVDVLLRSDTIKLLNSNSITFCCGTLPSEKE
jgi:hypothetical protein